MLLTRHQTDPNEEFEALVERMETHRRAEKAPKHLEIRLKMVCLAKKLGKAFSASKTATHATVQLLD